MKNNLDFCEIESSGFVKYPKIPYIEENPDLFGREVYVFEKIDGSLSQVSRTKAGIFGGSKANYISGATKRPPWAQKFLKWMHSNHSLYNLPSNTILFGEWLEPVTIDYDKDCLDKFYFIDLAILDENNNPNFYDYDEAVDYFSEWDIEGVEVLPPIIKGFVDENVIRDIVLYRKSQLRTGDINLEKKLSEKLTKIETQKTKTEMEGVVLKNYNLQEFAKFLHPKHSEIREQEKTLETKYININRVNKAKRRLTDQGNSRFSLDELIEDIVEDIKEESGISFEKEAVKGVLRIHNYYIGGNNH